MQRQQSQQNRGPGRTSTNRANKRGILYVVAVPIGSLDDITLRALRTLGEVDLIASEDPAMTQRLLSYHGIDATVTSYGPAHLTEKSALLIDRLQRGVCVALVSDCGSPMIADPGSLLVTSAHAHGIPVISVPGPSALTAAVAAAGLSSDSFFFQGSLPETRGPMRRCLAFHLKRKTPTVAFCTPASLMLALNTIARIAPRRRLILACDLTTPKELIIRGTARQVQQRSDGSRTNRVVTIILA